MFCSLGWKIQRNPQALTFNNVDTELGASGINVSLEKS